MVFNSLEFLIFYPAVLILYFLVPTKFRWILLLAASYYFYLSWNVELVFLIVFTTVISYCAALAIEKSPKKSLRKLCLAATLVCSLGVLLFYKYFDFLAGSVISAATLFGAKLEPFSLGLILPVGISFYTFQTLSYVIDVYRGNITAERHFGYYALYVSFFPQLVAGPIERPENLIPQLREDHRFNRDDTREGIRMMLIGFFKKIAVADLCAAYVVPVYSDPSAANGPAVLLATVLFAFQIYGDFAGYTDIAIGCARVMGIRLMKNFDRPYTAESIKEFWARWHISLSSWFRDYLYIPLGGNRCSRARHLLNLMTVFLVSGLWHGAAWTYVLWGFLHGMYQVVGILTKKLRAGAYAALRIDPDSKPAHIWRRAVTFALVSFAWIFFRAGSIGDLGILLGKLFTAWQPGEAFASAFDLMRLDLPGAAAVIAAIAVMCLLDRNGLASPASDSTELTGRRAATETIKYASLIWAIAFAWLVLLEGNGASSFIYFQF
ncbi:putative uncharacterized protein [Anaerotruncus sp. CAG:390]|nr:putative uncharacterized protein [Anaerotruncus sp. CAG:390]